MIMSAPPPPVPADADLTHYDDMPLEVRRLRDSGIAGVPDAEIFRSAVLLWCVAWHQIPAGSLPNDDAELCRLVGLGRDLKTWRKIKQGVLRGWQLFGDGRLYHKVVSEKVISAWNGTLFNRWGKECDRVRKENKAREKRGEKPLDLPLRPATIPLEWPAVSAGIPTEIPPVPVENGLNRIEGNRSNKKNTSAAATPTDAARATAEAFPPENPPAEERRPPTNAEVDAAYAAFQPIAFELKIPDFGFLNGDRRRALIERLTECGPDGWAVAMTNLRTAEWLRDDDDPSKPKHWVNLANLLKPENFTGLLEGRYAERHEAKSTRKGGSAGTRAAQGFAYYASVGAGHMASRGDPADEDPA